MEKGSSKWGADEPLAEFETPPFRPIGEGSIAEPHEHGDDEDGAFHILPVDTDNRPDPSNPHDPLSDEAKDAHDAEGDFTEVTNAELASDEKASEHTGPTSFETDSNPSSTTFCTESHNPEKPLVQYALTIDAGSTGSRIHVYKFNNCHAMPSLEYETFKMTNPGLSAFARDPTAAAASLDSLLDEAKRVVPEDMWNCSPVEVKATAGLRLLGAKESEAILDEVRNRLETNYPFVVGSERSVEIMDGKDEGGSSQYLKACAADVQVFMLGSRPTIYRRRLERASTLPILWPSWIWEAHPPKSSLNPSSLPIQSNRLPKVNTSISSTLAARTLHSTSTRISATVSCELGGAFTTSSLSLGRSDEERSNGIN